MFNSLTKEIWYYSIIPFIVITVIVLILMMIGRKKENNYYKFNYSIKVLLFIMIALVLPLITGYTIWVYERFIDKGILSSKILYMVLLGVLNLSLLIVLIVSVNRLLKSFKESHDEE